MLDGPGPIPVGQEPPPLRPPPPPAGSNGQPRGNRQAKEKPSRRSTGDRFAVLNAFVDAGMDGLSRVELATWLVLYRDTRNGVACTSMESIATRAGCSKRGVVKAIERLRRCGLLVRITKGSNLRGPSVYRVRPMPHPPSDK